MKLVLVSNRPRFYKTSENKTNIYLVVLLCLSGDAIRTLDSLLKIYKSRGVAFVIN